MHTPLILKSKLTIPKSGKDILRRHLLDELHKQVYDYPVCAVTASAGFGKTTLVAQMVQSLNCPTGWYTPGPEDDSAYIFLSYLVSALEEIIPGIAEWYFTQSDQQKFDWKRAFEILLAGIERVDANNEGILVIDDWHLLQRDPEVRAFFDRFLFCKPEGIRVILISRETISLPNINRLRTEAMLLEVEGKDLAFSREEIEELLARVAPERLSSDLINSIYTYTEGWIMAIKLVLNANQQSPYIPHSTFSSLFEYLSYAILDHLEEGTRQFLIKSSIPDFFGYQLCQEVLGCTPAEMDKVIGNGLFISEVNNGLYRYHNLFRDFLYRQAKKSSSDFKEINNRLALFYLGRDEREKALSSFINAENWEDAGKVLISLARDLVYSGRGQVLKNHLFQLPEQYREHPQILLAFGDEERFACAYSKAITYYRQAEEKFLAVNDEMGLSKAYRGIGEIYLETLEPKAAEFLFKAFRVLGKDQRAEKAAIMQLLAENKINQGKPQQAERYRRMATMNQLLVTSKNNLEARMLLRTGRVNEAIKALESQVNLAQDLPIIHSTFREAPMLLSSCYSFIGKADQAIDKAEEVIRMGRNAGQPMFEGLGYIRLGHALLIKNCRQTFDAEAAYNSAHNLLKKLDVIRVHSELNMGRCLVYALQGAWDKAEAIGLEGLDIAKHSQDDWFTALLEHVLGMAAALCSQKEKAYSYFKQAQGSFESCGDSLGKCVVYWWLSYLVYLDENEAEFALNYGKFTDLVTTCEYQFLLERTTLFGDIEGIKAPLLQKAAEETQSFWSQSAEVDTGNKASEDYKIKIYTLGQFYFIREGKEIPLKDWRRKNALRLFNLFLVKRRTLLNKEEIIDYLWPEATTDFAERNFKSALYNLNKVLEPDRKPWGSSYFIQRNGSTYFFNLAANFWLDVDDFIVSIERAKKIWRDSPEQAAELLSHALSIYKGDFLLGVNMDEWCIEERERLIVLYIKAAEMLAKLQMQRGQYDTAIKFADLILEKDKYWERAYQLKIWCYKMQNNMVMATRVYNQCVQRLKDELGIAPSQKTLNIYQQINEKNE